MKKINERIKERRTVLGLTLLDIAEQLGVREATVQRYESGKIENLKYDTIINLSKILKCSPAYLLGFDDSPDYDNGEKFSQKEKAVMLAYRKHPTMQDAVDTLLGIEKQPEKKLSPTVSDIKPKTYIVRTAGRGEGVKDVEMTAEEIEFYKNLPDVDETDL